MSSLNRLSTIVAEQLPDFIRQDHPIFVEFLEKYYEYLEQPGNPVYELKRFQDNYDVDKTREEYLKYFKDKILPSFPDNTELSIERILKASRDFYAKKGTPDSFKFIFRALFNTDLEVFFPKLQILKASDGKWNLPQAFRLTLTGSNVTLDLNLIEKRKAYGSLSRASCVVESANRTLDKGTNREIVEIYVSSLNRLFQNGEFLEIEYIDSNGNPQTFSEKIIGALSNIRINSRRRGTRYMTGDPVVINGGLDTTSPTKVKAIATVGNVTTGSIDSVTVLVGGYGFREFPNSLVDIITANGVGANVIVSSVDTANNIEFDYNIDSIYYKANIALNAASYTFDNVAGDVNTVINDAFTYEKINVYPISLMTLVNGGAFFDEEPTLNVVPLFESDFSTDNLFITIPPGNFNTYNNVNASFRLSGAGYSSINGWYNGFRVLIERHFRTIVDYDGATKTVFLDRPFEDNINQTNILTRTLRLDSRPVISDMGRIAHIQIVNGGTGYSGGDTVSFIGTGYGATASLTVSGGVITGVSLTNRGEGYTENPTVVVNTSGGTGAVLNAFRIGDGEQFDVITGDIGQIRDFVLTNRGSDYITTPNVSLKIFDLNVAPILDTESILENDIVYQGANINSTTFRAIVDEYYPGNNVLRVFNYSGSPTVGQNLVVYKTSSANVNTLVRTANIDGKIYPYRYGDGKARANAEFLNGLIRYNGFYLNTDGHLSSDKKLQDDDKYHNFSYSLISEASYSQYEKPVLDILHPAGAKLIPVHVIKQELAVAQQSNINTHIYIENSNTLINNCNVAYGATQVTGMSENFDVLANTNDFIVINSDNVYRTFTKVITAVDSNNSLNIESACIIVGEGRGNVTQYGATLQIKGNTNAINKFISTSDQIKINVGNTVLVKTINSISGNVITLNSNTGIDSTNSNLVYLVLPQFNEALYQIIQTAR